MGIKDEAKKRNQKRLSGFSQVVPEPSEQPFPKMHLKQSSFELAETCEWPHFAFTVRKSENNGPSSTVELAVGDKSSSCPEERE